MFCLVCGEIGVAVFLHQLLFLPEVDERILNQVIQGLSKNFFTAALRHRRMQFIQQTDPLLVLPVDQIDLHAQRFIPLDECHRGLLCYMP